VRGGVRLCLSWGEGSAAADEVKEGPCMGARVHGSCLKGQGYQATPFLSPPHTPPAPQAADASVKQTRAAAAAEAKAAKEAIEQLRQQQEADKEAERDKLEAR